MYLTFQILFFFLDGARRMNLVKIQKFFFLDGFRMQISVGKRIRFLIFLLTLIKCF
jgi:hypothetical protein